MTMDCRFDGCDRHVCAKGLCQTHYHQERRGEELRPISGKGGALRRLGMCEAPDCDRPAKAKGYCSAHRKQLARGEELRPIRVHVEKQCAGPDCERTAQSQGLCGAHYAQSRKGKALTALQLVPKYRYADSGGYVRLYDPTHPNAARNGMVLEHTKIMSDHLGRMLWPDENVHHKNGKRDDNRLSNLELWSTRQPKGQRVEDKVEFALEMLRRYAPEKLKEP